MSLQISSSSPPPSHITVDSISNNIDQKKREIEYKTTPYVVLVCITAASGGLLFGYDLGISGGLFFLLGSMLDGAAQNLAMLFVGRIVLGVGIGFTNQAVPLYLSEMAPPKLRGTLTTMFSLAIGVGITSAYLVNYGMQNIVPWGWRLSLSLAFVPALIIVVGFVFLPDSPSSLIQSGDLDQGLLVLKKIRGTNDVQEEFDYLLQARELSNNVKNHWKNIIKRNYRPQLVMAFAIPFFQQVTGINIITFYLPILIETLGFGPHASLFTSLVLGAISLVLNTIAAISIDKFGRRKVFFLGGITMLLFLVLTGALLQWKLKAHNELSTIDGVIGVVFIFGFVVCFAWSWGPLAWLIPSEIFPLEIRSAGQSINICVLMLFISITAQSFLAMLCHLKATIFYFFGGWVFIMTIFTYFLLPETKGVPLEDIANLWKQHPFWRRYCT